MIDKHKAIFPTQKFECELNKRERIQSIDILRGIIMIIMLLDHISVIWNGYDIDPTRTGPILFFSQWVSHFCAPFFILLTGISAYLAEHYKNLSKKESAFILTTRGVWLIILEIFIFSFILRLDFRISGDIYFIILQVMWVIGISMILLSVLQFLNSRVLIVIGLIMIFTHNLIPNININSSLLQLLWNILHQSGSIISNPHLRVDVWFPIIPWVGVMALGYGMGEFFMLEKTNRKNILLYSGFILTILFIAIRMVNIYGDPIQWSIQRNFVHTLMSFLNCEKYPPSLLFLLMTLGPGLMVLSILDNLRLKKSNVLIVFGRTPMFFYLIHFILVNLTAVLWGLIINNFKIRVSIESIPFNYNLIYSYIIWIAMTIVLYFPCHWYSYIKFEKTKWWTYYL